MLSFTPVRLAFSTIDPEEGENAREPVIFLHGMTLSQKNWGDIPKTVSKWTKRKVYVVDARNHGDSEWSNDFSFDVNTDDLLHFMDEQKICKAFLVGHSMGGATAYLAALKAPDRVAGVLSEDMSIVPLPQNIIDVIIYFFGLQQDAIKSMPTGLDEAGARRFIAQHSFDHIPEDFRNTLNIHSIEDMKETPPELTPTPDGRFRAKSNLDVFKTTVKDSFKEMSDLKGTYSGPVSVIYGKLSVANIGSHTDKIRKVFPNAEVIGITGASHAVHADKPKEFTKNLLLFLSGK